MVRDAYANYVVQTAIDVVPEGNEKQMLLEELRENEVQLVSPVLRIPSRPISSFRNSHRICHGKMFLLTFQRNYTFAKHIVAKLGSK